MTWYLTYTSFGRCGLRSVRENYETREEAERAARRYRLEHYEIWQRVVPK